MPRRLVSARSGRRTDCRRAGRVVNGRRRGRRNRQAKTILSRLNLQERIWSWGTKRRVITPMNWRPALCATVSCTTVPSPVIQIRLLRGRLISLFARCRAGSAYRLHAAEISTRAQKMVLNMMIFYRRDEVRQGLSKPDGGYESYRRGWSIVRVGWSLSATGIGLKEGGNVAETDRF